MRRIVLAAVIVLTAPVQVAAKQAHKEFSEAWAERDARYEINVAEALSESQLAVDTFENNQDFDQTNAKLASMFDDMYRARYAEGRLKLLRDFRIHIFSKPSRNATDMWMQDRMEQIRLKHEDAQRRFEAVNQIQFSSVENVKAFITGREQAIIIGGQAHGEVEELNLLSQNLMLYHNARSAEDTRRAERRMALGNAISQGFNRMSQSYQAAAQTSAQRSWNARCTTNHGVTNCSGY